MPRRRLSLVIALLGLGVPGAPEAAPAGVSVTLHVDLGPRPGLRARTVKAALVQAVSRTRGFFFRPLEALLEPDLAASPVVFADGARPRDSSDARIEAHPVGAEVKIDGTFVGFSPVTARGLSPGRHQVQISRVGFHTRTLSMPPASLPGPGAALEVRLDPLPGRPDRLLGLALEEAASSPHKQGHPHQRAAARRLGQRVLLLARLRPRGGLIVVKLFAYDARSDRAVSQATISVTAEDPERGCRQLVASVVPFLSAPPRRRAGEGEGWLTRARRGPYFWPAVGAGVVIIGAAVGLGVYYGTREDGPGPGRRLVALPVVLRR